LIETPIVVESGSAKDTGAKEIDMSITDLPGAASLPSAADLLSSIDEAQLRPGTKVEVRRRFDAKWARGFEVIETTGEHYRLRRVSDGETLPVPFAHADVRREKHQNNWWY
jgi:hypothetical protein